MLDDKFLSEFKQCRDCGEYFPRTSGYFHIQPRFKDGLGPYCKDCHRARGRKNITKLRAENPEYGKDYYQNNKEKVLARTNQYYQDHKAEHAEWSKRWRVEHREEYNELSRNYRNDPANKERLNKLARISAKRRYDENQEVRQKNKVYGANYKARKRKAVGKHSPQEVLDLLEWQDYKCFYCGADLHEKYSEDHYYPLNSDIKDNSIHNIYLACISCNSSKQDKLPFLFDNRCI